jgi:peroxiredoxin/mono/diheme cytochrome c family protein
MDAWQNQVRRFYRPGLKALGAVGLSAALVFAGWQVLGMGRGHHGPAQGEVIEDFTLPDLDGRAVTFSSELAGRSALVLVFSGIDCPVGNLYVPRLNSLAQAMRGRGVGFLSINSNAHEEIEQIKKHTKEHQIDYPVLKDWNNKLADRLHVDRVGEVFLIDASGRLSYRGAVDDQFARGGSKPEPTRHYLAEAIDAALRGGRPPVAVTSVLTCPIDRVAPERSKKRLRRPSQEFARLRRKESPSISEAGPVDYARHVAPILRERCQQCHRPGEVAPFSLLSYEDARRWSESIYEVVDQGLMPPWHADPRHGRFANDRSLTEQERATLLAWVEQGAAAGDLSVAPPPAEARQGWTIGAPDLVFEMPESFDIPAEGVLPIQKFYVPTHFEHDVWVSAAQAMPGDRAVVHHICVFLVDPASRESGSADMEQRRRERPELVCYAPGDMPSVFPEGVAKRIPAGSLLEIQVHYQPVGVPRFDRSSVGIRVARGRIDRLALTRGVANRDFVLRPGVANIEVKASYTILEAGRLLSMTPHMHYRGRDMLYTAIYPDGRREVLLSVPCYDFNWQNVYRLAEPKFLPKSTRIECVAHFDNSTNNPFNPDPRKEVRWGEQSTDEMMIGYFDYCVDLAEPRMADGRATQRH